MTIKQKDEKILKLELMIKEKQNDIKKQSNKKVKELLGFIKA